MSAFFQIAQFVSRQKHSKKYVLVHCTHGHNRTGYMIVHYLMRSLSMSVTQVSFFFLFCLDLWFFVSQKHYTLELFGSGDAGN